VKPHVMFLRTACLLPDGLDLAPKRFSDAWMSVEETTSATMDLKVRGAGWHFLWLKDTYSRLAFAQTEALVVTKAVSRALKEIKGGFNAAEFDELVVSRYPGFRVARATLHARHIQQEALLSPALSPPIRKIVA
jgi:hypothetical protein